MWAVAKAELVDVVADGRFVAAEYAVGELLKRPELSLTTPVVAVVAAVTLRNCWHDHCQSESDLAADTARVVGH